MTQVQLAAMLRHLDAAASSAWQAMRALRPLSLGTIQSSRMSHLYSPFLQTLPLQSTAQRPLVLQSLWYSATPQPQPKSHPTDHALSPSDTDFATAKPFDAIPSPKRIPLIGMSSDFMKFSPSQAVQLVHKRVEKFGRIYREKFVPGLPEFLFVLDPEDVAKVFRADGRHPRRFPISEWTDIRKELNLPIGLFLS